MRWLVVLCFFSCGFAQYNIGVIISQSGQAATDGQAQLEAVKLFTSQLQENFESLKIIIQDDGSNPQETLEQARDLIVNQGVIALVCCTLKDSLEAISETVNDQSIITLSPSDLPQASTWVFSTKPDHYRMLQSVILQLAAKGQQSIGVMTLDSSLGYEVDNALKLLLSPNGMRLGVMQKYPPDASVLTPEALWVATRLPETVLVWGTSRDAALAYKALRERGYERDVILNPESLTGINLLEVDGASFILSPVQMSENLPHTHPTYLNSFRFASHMPPVNINAAYLYDALGLLKAALEQVFTYGIPSNDIPALRYAMRDALIGLDAYNGVSAVYDYSETDHLGLDPYSLVIAKLSQGGWVIGGK
jgi:branched-chain amino acid transport system substrate-binding protein